jgi:F-type H+-transporting ATPase subunit delta
VASVLGDADLVPLLEDPKIRYEDKKAAVGQHLAGVNQLAMNLAYLLLLRRRVRLMPQIAEEFARLVNRQRGVEHAEVTTATEIDEITKRNLVNHLAKLTGRQVILSTKVNPEIIGGFIARVGDKVIDGSVGNKLQRLKQDIAQQA